MASDNSEQDPNCGDGMTAIGADEDSRLGGFMDYEGVPVSTLIDRSTMDAMKTFEVRDDDVFGVTYIKSGTHLLGELISYVIAGGDESKVHRAYMFGAIEWPAVQEFKDTTKTNYVPTYKSMVNWDSPRVMLSHLPVQFLPPKIWTSKARVIYMIRNPRDCAVSMHRFWRFPGLDNFDDFFTKLYLTDDMIFQGHLNHCLAYWKKRHDEHVLFLKYEDVIKNPSNVVKQVAKHLNRPLSEESVKACVEGIEIENMRKTYAKIEEETEDGIYLTRGYGHANYVYKGGVGGWRDHFSVALSEYTDDVVDKKLKGSGLKFEYV